MQTTQAKPQIVHESETQRQHVRVQIPATVEIDGKIYSVKDLSSGGVSLKDVDGGFTVGQKLTAAMTLPFGGFSLNVDISSDVEYYKDEEKTLGLRFIELGSEQISVLNLIIRSYMSGTMVTEGDLLSVVSRENFVKIRHHGKEEAPTKTQLLRRALPSLVIVVAALVGLYFLSGNILERLLLVKSYDSLVKSDIIIARATNNGTFKFAISENTEKVTAGQVLGTIETSVALPATTGPAENANQAATVTTNVVSPCDCIVANTFLRDGEFRAIGEPLFKLIPQNASPWVSAIIQPADAQRLNLQDSAKIHIVGESAPINGHITNIESRGDTTPITVVTVRPDNKISSSLIDRPAYVEFFVMY